MTRLASLALFALILPGAALAAPLSYQGGANVLVASSTPGNRYATGGSVTLATPVSGDFTAVGGTISSEAPITGDALFIGGSVHAEAPIAGDVRGIGAQVSIDAPVGGDVAITGGSVTVSAPVGKNAFIAGITVNLLGGAQGDALVYGNAVTLGGNFGGNVTVVAQGPITIASSTVIHGALRYEAPQEARVATGASIRGGIFYTGASYLPTSTEARAISLASFGVFLIIKILGALILVGLIAGLFPAAAETVTTRALSRSTRQALLALLLGFAILMATPLLFILLAITFVGLGLGALILFAYFLLLMLGFVYAAVVLGAFVVRLIFKRTEQRWSDAVLGMLVLYLLWSLPYVGWPIFLALFMYLLGILAVLLYEFAFPHEA